MRWFICSGGLTLRSFKHSGFGLSFWCVDSSMFMILLNRWMWLVGRVLWWCEMLDCLKWLLWKYCAFSSWALSSSNELSDDSCVAASIVLMVFVVVVQMMWFFWFWCWFSGCLIWSSSQYFLSVILWHIVPVILCYFYWWNFDLSKGICTEKCFSRACNVGI